MRSQTILLALALVLCLEIVDSQRATRRPTRGPTRGTSTRRGTTRRPTTATGATEPVTEGTHTGSDTTHTGTATTHTGTATTNTGTTQTGTTQTGTPSTTTPTSVMDDKCGSLTVEIPPFMQCVEQGCTAREPCRSPDLAGRYCCPHSFNGAIQNCCFSAGRFYPAANQAMNVNQGNNFNPGK